MIVLFGIWVWLVVGCVLGRIVFVRILGDAPRRDLVERRDYHGYPTKRYGWTAR